MLTAIARARKIDTTPTYVVLETDDGRFSVPWEDCSPRLARATEAERSMCQLSPSGYGIRWPLIDEDLAVGPLLELAEKT